MYLNDSLLTDYWTKRMSEPLLRGMSCSYFDYEFVPICLSYNLGSGMYPLGAGVCLLSSVSWGGGGRRHDTQQVRFLWSPHLSFGNRSWVCWKGGGVAASGPHAPSPGTLLNLRIFGIAYSHSWCPTPQKPVEVNRILRVRSVPPEPRAIQSGF